MTPFLHPCEQCITLLFKYIIVSVTKFKNISKQLKWIIPKDCVIKVAIVDI